MKGTINLRNQIMIDGKKIAELTYDTEKITPELYLKALNYTVAKGNGVTGANIKIDAGAALALGMYAVIAENPKYDITDVERITGSDINKLVDIGMSFILGRDALTEEPSEEPSETTQKHTTQTS
jgi:hypothetical protein